MQSAIGHVGQIHTAVQLEFSYNISSVSTAIKTLFPEMKSNSEYFLLCLLTNKCRLWTINNFIVFSQNSKHNFKITIYPLASFLKTSSLCSLHSKSCNLKKTSFC